jgi:SAM-dependent methyltransferase
MATFWDLMEAYIPDDHARQMTSWDVAHDVLQRDSLPERVLDLGCGSGGSIDLFRSVSASIEWVGVDIESSPEVEARVRSDGTFYTYDGVRLPFADGSFSFVYSHQVFEHVREPEPLLRDITRVLAPGGLFVGSTSQLEPYHSNSLFNYTVSGFAQLVKDAGLEPVEFRPSIDGITLIKRSFEGRPEHLTKFFAEESPLNQEIEAWGHQSGRRPALVNSRKLQFCGQFAFIVRRPI